MSTSASASWRLGGLCVDLTVAGTTSQGAKLTRMVTWDEWRAGATHIEVGGLDIATYDLGPAGAPTYTFCHGYPSASLDIAGVAAQLDGLRLLALDMPGFGASDKPPADQGGGGHTYSIHAAADAVEALWAAKGTARTLLVAHDYSVSVAQELLARRAEGTLADGTLGPPTDITGVVWMNGGLYPDLHRPTPGQQLLLDPDHGAEVAAAVDEAAFTNGLRGTWGERRPFDEAASREIFRSMDDGGGVALMHDLLHYVADRRAHADRWRSALEGADLPMVFVWGLLDPVSGGHVVPRLVDHVPQGRIVALDDVGHWPPLEAPDDVAAEIAALAAA
jgi:pimeloyl-ACP methyl ester carboxylesterase